MTWLSLFLRANRSRFDLVHIAFAVTMALALFVAVKGIARIPDHYRAEGRDQCQHAYTAKALQQVSAGASAVATKAREDIGRSLTTGNTFERARSRIQSHFQRLENEARHAPTSPADQCVLPDARLRLWIDANDGPGVAAAPDRSAAPVSPDAGASTSAPAHIGSDGGSGSQPPRGGQGLSRTGGAAVRAAELP